MNELSLTAQQPIDVYTATDWAVFSDVLTYGFTGKPWSMGGPRTEKNSEILIRQNQCRLLDELGYAHLHWRLPSLSHESRMGRCTDQSFQATDGVLLTEPGIPVLMTFADCVPVLLFDPVHQAGALIHAGWRGTALNIAREGIIALQNAVNSSPSDVYALLGPAISLAAYEVTKEVVQPVLKSIEIEPEHAPDHLLQPSTNSTPSDPRYLIDLRHVIALQLKYCGVNHIEQLPFCTYSENEQFFSHRQGDSGRNAAFMILK